MVALARAQLAAGRPERSAALLEPILAAAQRAGWHEAAASASLVLGLSQEGAAARASLARSVELARDHGLPGVEWEACAALARLSDGDEAAALRATSGEIVDRLARGIGDERLAGEFMLAGER